MIDLEMNSSGLPRLPFFWQTLVRCLRRSTSSGKSDFLGDEFVMSSSTAHGKVFFAIAAFSCFQESPVRLVVGLTGHTAREPVVMHPSVWDHEVPLVMLFVNLPFTRQLPTIQVNLVVW